MTYILINHLKKTIMEKEENRKQCVSTDELMEKLREQGIQIVESVMDNDAGMCALVILGTKDRTISMVHSNPSGRLVLAMANAAVRDENLLYAMEFAVQSARAHISSGGDAEKKEDRT